MMPCQELVGVSWEATTATAPASTEQVYRPMVHLDWAGANRWRNNTIVAAMLVLRRCEQAVDGLCVDPSPDWVVT